jgi:hypothetical protein
MGYDREIFQELVKPYNDCTICSDVLKDAVSVPCCHGLFCYACIRQWYDTDTRCPLCKHQLTFLGISKRCKRTNKNISTERVCCSLKDENDCTWIGQLCDLEGHIASAHIACPFKQYGCQVRGTEDSMTVHIAENEFAHLKLKGRAMELEISTLQLENRNLKLDNKLLIDKIAALESRLLGRATIPQRAFAPDRSFRYQSRGRLT